MAEGNPLGREQPDPRQDNQEVGCFGQTPWQTVGPFFHYGLPWKGGADLIGQSDMGARPDLFPPAHYLLNLPAPKAEMQGEVIEITGQVLDGAALPVPDAMIELWQANHAGRYASPADPRGELPLDPDFTGFGRASTSDTGEFRFRTIRPGRVPGPHQTNAWQAPHIALGVMGRGLLKRLVTRLYFAGDPANDEDPILALVPPERRQTLMAQRGADGTWRFDIRLQGDGETVFFDF
jgi:protocatechuate 3,4-dioxygenase alpha subunit